MVDTIVEGIQEKKGHGIVIADMSGIDGAVAHYFIICEGNSPTQVEAIAGEVSDRCREKLHEKPQHCVGLEEAVWVVSTTSMSWCTYSCLRQGNFMISSTFGRMPN